ncbi:MAG: hypothetical protein A4S14_08205 [Proteobacteria bacterium SG_bin9]|nr:MAG: hypothetical protein A4S14_08205 [Proteobacteria bacterium SG_bin9]
MRVARRPLIAALSFGFIAALAATMPLEAAFAQAKQQPAPAPQAAPPPPPEIKQIALTEKQVENVITAQKDLDVITDKLPEGAADKPDAKLLAQFEDVVKKYGFASYAEYGQVVDNVSLVMSGIEPKSKAFTDPPALIKQQIAAIEADKKIPPKDKQAVLAEMKQAEKYAVSVQFPDNVKLVTKYYDKLVAALQEDDEPAPPPPPAKKK